jgi:hypothetical protein
MRYEILTKINADDHLAQLLNAYQGELGLLEQVVLPRESMGEFQRLLDSANSAPQQRRPTAPHLPAAPLLPFASIE